MGGLLAAVFFLAGLRYGRVTSGCAQVETRWEKADISEAGSAEPAVVVGMALRYLGL